MENHQPAGENTSKEPESIFSGEEFSMDGYDKHIRHARNALYVSAVILLINVLILNSRHPESYEYAWLDWLVYGLFIIGFVALALWTKSKPYYAIIGGMLLFALFLLLQLWIDAGSLFKGLLWKIFVAVYLVKGLSNAREAQELRDGFNR